MKDDTPQKQKIDSPYPLERIEAKVDMYGQRITILETKMAILFPILLSVIALLVYRGVIG